MQFGKVIGNSKDLRSPPSFVNSMFENIAPGNTMLLNNSAVKLINSSNSLSINHYDSWIYLLISCFGKVDLITSHLVKYRVHSNNSVGLRKNSIKPLREAISSYLHHQSLLLENYFEFLSKEDRRHLIRISFFVKEKNIAKRIVLLKNIQIGRQSILDEVIFKFLMLFAK
jgi:hypothetical protein